MCRTGHAGNAGNSSSSNFLFSGPDVYEQFRHLDMPGASGRVRINEATGTRDYETMSFVIWNVRALPKVDDDDDDEGNIMLTFVPSLRYQDSRWYPIVDNKFLYKDGSEDAPDSLPPVSIDKNYIGNTTRSLGYVFMGITLCSVAVSLVWLILNRRARVVTSAQPTFLLMISLGVAIMSLTILPLSWDELSVDAVARLNASCMLTPWLYFIGVSLITGALLAKVMALNEAYINSELESINVSAWMILRSCLSLVLLNSLVLLPWTLVSPMEWIREETSARDLFNRSTNSFGYCESSNDVPFIVALSVLNAGAVILASLGSFRSRYIETEFGDSRYVGICLAVILHVWCLCVPIALVVDDNSEGIFWIATATVFVAAQAVLLLVYAPKMLALRTQRRIERLPKSRAQYDISAAINVNERRQDAAGAHNTQERSSRNEFNYAAAAAAIAVNRKEADDSREHENVPATISSLLDERRQDAVDTQDTQERSSSNEFNDTTKATATTINGETKQLPPRSMPKMKTLCK
jgi:hypothetical protein